jgi:uncharacterized protein (TIGR04255 family)
MSKLPKAPLLEVILDIRWDSASQGDIDKYEFLLGTLHSKLKDDFPVSKSLRPNNLQVSLPIFINAPTHRFESAENKGYPIYQLGPGVLTINTVDEYYHWETFHNTILKIASALKELYSFEPEKKITISLKYLDFYEVNAEKTNLFEMFKTKFNIDIASTFIPKDVNPPLINFSTAFNTKYGMFNLMISTGEINNLNRKGLIVDNTLSVTFAAKNWDNFQQGWLNDAHEYLSNFFKDMTKGELYNSFV